MPAELHRELARRARKQGLSGDRYNAYVYGTLNKVEKGESPLKTEMTKRKRNANRS